MLILFTVHKMSQVIVFFSGSELSVVNLSGFSSTGYTGCVFAFSPTFRLRELLMHRNKKLSVMCQRGRKERRIIF